MRNGTLNGNSAEPGPGPETPVPAGSRFGSPRVVMLLANEFVHDTRVFKEARSLIEWGCEVHVVAMARGDLPAGAVQDGIHVHRLAIRPRDIWRVAATAGVWWSRGLVGRLHGPLDCTYEDEAPAPAPAPSATTAPAPAPRAPVLPVRLAIRGRYLLRRAITRSGVPAAGRRLIRRLKRSYPVAFRLLALNHRFARAALDLEPDVVVAHDLNTLFGGLVVKRLAGAPLAYDSHELFLERNLGNRSAARDRLVWGPIQAFCIRRCDAVISVAESICQHLEKQYRIRRPHLVRNVQPFERPAPRSRLLARELGIPDETAIVLYPGAITINRGLETMIDSAADLDGAVYVIMGYARNPKYLESLRARARAAGVLGSRLFFREAVPIEDVVRYTASADLGIVPTQNVCLSYFYESSNKIFHCVMAGVPLAMSDHAEKRMLAETYGIAVLFDETDPADVAATVNRALADRAGYAGMARRCLDAARTLNWEHEEHKLRRIFAGLLGERARPVPPVPSVPPAPELRMPQAEVDLEVTTAPGAVAAR